MYIFMYIFVYIFMFMVVLNCKFHLKKYTIPC